MRQFSRKEETAVRLAAGLLEKAHELLVEGFVDASTPAMRAAEAVLDAGGFPGGKILETTVSSDSWDKEGLLFCIEKICS